MKQIQNTKYKYKMSITRRLNRAMGHLLIYIFNFITSSSKRVGVSKKKRFYEMFFVQMFTFPVQCHFFAQLIVSQCQCIGQVLFPLLALHWCTLTQGNIFMCCFRKRRSSLSLSNNKTSLQVPLTVMFITWQSGISEMQKCLNMQVGFS